MKEAGNKPPAMVPNRGMYMTKDLNSLSKYYGVKLRLPDEFMEWILTKSTVNSQRFLIALQLNAPDYVEATTRSFWQRLFGDGKEIMSLECLPEVGKNAGIPEDVLKKCLNQIKSDAVKGQLKKNVEEVLEEGAFGMPTYVAHINGKKRMYFGQDRLPLLAFEAGKPYLGPISPKL